MMYVAFDAQSTSGKVSGLGVYTQSLLSALMPLTGNRLRISPFQSSSAGDMNTVQRLSWEVCAFPAHVRTCKPDLVHVPAFAAGWHSVPTVMTVHDLVELAFPNQRGLGGIFYWKHWLPYAVKRADHLICVSEFTKSDVIKYLRVPEKKISVVLSSGHEKYSQMPQSAGSESSLRGLGITGRFFLFVGTFEPRKNLKRVFEAFSHFLRETGAQAQLVCVGAQSFARGAVFHELLRTYGISSDRIICPGYLLDQSLAGLYRSAEALVFPSLYEGFGLPVLEAMGAGCPVITSSVTSLPEVAGQAAIFTAPENTREIAAAMKRIYAEPELRTKLKVLGFERVREFSWEKTARQVVDVYEKVLGDS